LLRALCHCPSGAVSNLVATVSPLHHHQVERLFDFKYCKICCRYMPHTNGRTKQGKKEKTKHLLPLKTLAIIEVFLKRPVLIFGP
jgi:hypothetical protein